MRSFRVIVTCVLTAAGLAAYHSSTAGAVPRLGRRAAAADSALGGKLSVPAGFQVSYFASGLKGVRFMVVGPDNAIYASQPGSGRVLRLPDRNRDGVADTVETVVDGLKQPHGLAFHKGALYVANTDGVVRVPIGANGLAAGAPVYVNHVDGGKGHSSRTVIFGADGGMYVSVGSSCNICVEENPDRATVLRFNEDGSGRHVFSSGLRNAVGLAVNPVTKDIWVTQNERDNLLPSHEDLPPEEINILKDGGDYGWPYCYGDRIPNPEFHDAARCARTIAPALGLQAHSAPLGLSFLNHATKFPADYRGDVLVAYHGSWNRDAATGAKVVRIHVKDNKPVSVEDFVTGWQSPDGKRWGRPVDIVVAADGSVLISDDAGGAIYRVVH